MSKKQINNEIRDLAKLLEIEKQEDLSQYRQKIAATSISERRKNGVLWYPVSLENTKYSSSEQLLVKISRNKDLAQAHLFQSGKLLSLFSNIQNQNEEDSFVTGIVNQVSENEMLITLNSNSFPEWINKGKLGVQLLFDENSYKEMQNALNFLIKTDEKRINELKEIILSDKEPYFEQKYIFENPKLNKNQNIALNKIAAAKDIAIVHGPPGTGKTTTLINSILHTLKSERQVLVCAPSNAAVDLLVEKLAEKGTNIVRIGHPARVTEKILNHSLDFLITRHENYKDLRAIRKQAQEYKKLAGKYKRNFGPEERQQRKQLYSEARKLNDEAKQLSFYISNDILNNAQVIASTMIGANNYQIKNKKFSTVFIDEAAQGLEPATWIPIIKAQRVILAGDHFQLPPTIKSFEAAKKGLSTTLFEKAIQRNNADIMLEEQYRMNEKIMHFSASFFYKNKLFANERVKNHLIFDTDSPLEFIDTAGMGFSEQINPETKSSFNKEEVELLFKHLSSYLYKVEKKGFSDNIQNIAIISPYKAQIILMQEFFDKNLILPENIKQKISVNTIDSFQGQERDIIYISLVRSNEHGQIGFLSDIRRMNVAMTRARKKLVIFGDSGTICKNIFYDKLIDYVNEINAYKSGYEILY